MPGFNSKVAKNSGKRTPCCPTTCQEESNDVSYVLIGAVSWEELGYKVKKDSFLQVFRQIDTRGSSVNAYVLFKERRNSGKMHPTWPISITNSIFKSVQSRERSLINKVTEIIFYRVFIYLSNLNTYKKESFLNFRTKLLLEDCTNCDI